MTNKENITAILECYFAGFKDEIIDSACNRILDQEQSSSEKPNKWIPSPVPFDPQENEEQKNCYTCTYSDEIDGSNCYECAKDIRDNYNPQPKAGDDAVYTVIAGSEDKE